MNKWILIALIVAASHVTAYADDSLRVTNAQGQGVFSEICQGKDDDSSHLTYTDDQGYLPGDFVCPENDYITIIPDSWSYHSLSERCPLKDKKLEVKKSPQYAFLSFNADYFLATGEYGAAAFAANDLAEAMRTQRNATYATAEAVTIACAAKSFSIPLEQALYFDSQQNKVVMSGAMQQAVLDYQRQHGLALTGRVDFQLTRSMSTAKNIYALQNGLAFSGPQPDKTQNIETFIKEIRQATSPGGGMAAPRSAPGASGNDSVEP